MQRQRALLAAWCHLLPRDDVCRPLRLWISETLLAPHRRWIAEHLNPKWRLLYFQNVLQVMKVYRKAQLNLGMTFQLLNVGICCISLIHFTNKQAWNTAVRIKEFLGWYLHVASGNVQEVGFHLHFIDLKQKVQNHPQRALRSAERTQWSDPRFR